MRLLIDINVLLDVVLKRVPWAVESARVLSAVDEGRAEAYVAGHTLTTIYYVVSKVRDRRAAAESVGEMLRIVRVVPMNTPDFLQALSLEIGDYEDAVQAIAGVRAGASCIVTRDERGFRSGPLPPLTPGEVLALL